MKKSSIQSKPNGNGHEQINGLCQQTLWSRKQVADALGLCIHSIARYTKAGLLPCVKLNKRVIRYRPADVQALIESSAVSSKG